MVEQTAANATPAGLTEHDLARGIAYEILSDLYVGEDDFYVEVRHTTTTGNVVHVEAWTEDDESFEFTCEVKFA